MRGRGWIILFLLPMAAFSQTVQQSFTIANIPSATWIAQKDMGVG
jgi:hypothetical protein